MTKPFVAAILLLSFVGLTVAGDSTVRTITLTDEHGTVVVVSETPGPNGTGPTIAVVATLPDGSTLRGIGKCTPDSNGNWNGDIPLTKDDGDGTGILPQADNKDYHLKLHADPDKDDGVPNEEGGELDFRGYQTGRGSIPLKY